MSLRSVTRVLLLLTIGAAQPVAAQIGDLEWRLHGGIVQPIGSSADYFKLGPSLSIDVLYPLSDRLGVNLDLGWDYLNTTDVYPTPTTNLWRYRIGLEAGLMGDPGGGILLKALGAVGATTVKSHEFWIESRRPYTVEGETINETALTASGGLRLGFQTSDGIAWWITGKLNWSPIDEFNQDALHELARFELDPLGSALNAALTIGVTLW
jgi:hypothetical protein